MTSETTPFAPRAMLVTGGAGFIGSNFVTEILAGDADVRVVDLDLLTYAGSLDNLEAVQDDPRHLFVRGDICDAELVRRLIDEHEVDTIVHFAAESHVDRSIDGPAAFVETNIRGTFTLLESARQAWLEARGWDASACRFHHISTDEVYGTLGPDDPGFSETTPYAPNSPYSAAKASSDHLVRAYQHTYGLPTVTTNCSNNYGPRQHMEKLLPTVIRSCHLSRPIPVYGDGSNIRDWLYVADHCSGIETVLRRGRIGECYNIGGDSERANIDLVKTICRIMDDVEPKSEPHERLITFVKDRPGHDWRYAIDATKMRAELGWTPRETLESGLRKTVEWYLGSERWRHAVEAGSGGERLGLGAQPK
ncbi:MAG: dTDP-glucose 4,6-dehydratase [Planctomycetes bacterium]|nr:dTDP-glucose 4,6-dehydratase [Planctomycetota bacterium]